MTNQPRIPSYTHTPPTLSPPRRHPPPSYTPSYPPPPPPQSDGHVCASRSTDGSLKLWDIRRFESPLAEWGSLPSIFSVAGCDFSPDESLVCAGTSVKKGEGKPQLAFYSLRTLQEVARIDLDGASIIPILWHPRLNQILLGNADGGVYALYDPTMSEKGVMYCNVKAPPKRPSLSFTGGALNIMTPHALPMFRDEELDHKRKRSMDRSDPLKSRKPEQVMSGPGTGGRTNVGFQQALLATMSGGVSGLGGTKDKIAMFQREDPREELLKYAQIAEDDPIYVTPAYAKNQPQVVLKQKKSVLGNRNAPRTPPSPSPYPRESFAPLTLPAPYPQPAP